MDAALGAGLTAYTYLDDARWRRPSRLRIAGGDRPLASRGRLRAIDAQQCATIFAARWQSLASWVPCGAAAPAVAGADVVGDRQN
jgi:hypothetical protein